MSLFSEGGRCTSQRHDITLVSAVESSALPPCIAAGVLRRRLAASSVTPGGERRTK